MGYEHGYSRRHSIKFTWRKRINRFTTIACAPHASSHLSFSQAWIDRDQLAGFVARAGADGDDLQVLRSQISDVIRLAPVLPARTKIDLGAQKSEFKRGTKIF